MKLLRVTLLTSLLVLAGCVAERVTYHALFTECGAVPAATDMRLVEGAHIGSKENVAKAAAIFDALAGENRDLRSIVRCYEAQAERGNE